MSQRARRTVVPPMVTHHRSMSPRQYSTRLRGMQLTSALLIGIVALLQAVAMATTDWYVLNVNEYIPTAKGGLWSYCYIATGSVLTPGPYTCLAYEELPNYSVFVNSRLYDSRVMLLCSAGFCLLILTIETVGTLILCCFRKPAVENSCKLGNKNSTNTPESEILIRPPGYFTYLAISLITLVGSVMDFVLKVSGFALFDSYVSNLLSYNTGNYNNNFYSFRKLIKLKSLLLISFSSFSRLQVAFLLAHGRLDVFQHTLLDVQSLLDKTRNNDHKTSI